MEPVGAFIPPWNPECAACDPCSVGPTLGPRGGSELPANDLPAVGPAAQASGSASDNGQQLIPAGPREPAGEAAPPPRAESQAAAQQAQPSTSTSPAQAPEKSLFKRHRDLIRRSWANFPKRTSLQTVTGRKLRGAQEEAEAGPAALVSGSGQSSPSSKARGLWNKVDPIKSSSWPLPSQGATSRDVSTIAGGGFSVVSSPSENAAGKSVQAQIKHRILQISEQLRVEQTNQEENMLEYRQLAAKAKKHQETQVWQVFEKRHKNTNATIAQLQKLLQSYQRKLLELENQGHLSKRLSNLQLNIESRAGSLSDSVLTPSGVLSTGNQDIPASILSSHLSASADNLPFETKASSSDLAMGGHEMPADNEDSAETVHSLEASKSGMEEQSFSNNTVVDQLAIIKSAQTSFETECKNLKDKYLLDHKLLLDSLKEEKHRHRVLEGHVNDLMQMNEIENLKQELAFVEEKMAYQAYEKERDIWEAIESLQSRITRLDSLQMSQQQEARENNRALELYGRAMNVLLAIITILLIFLSAVHACVLPLIKTRTRTIATLVGIVVWAMMWQRRNSLTELMWN